MRKCKDWLQSYLDLTTETESPSLFHLWVGCSLVAAALERHCMLDRGFYSLYPNLYIVLVGGSASVRKSTAVNIGHDLYTTAIPKVNIVSQKITGAEVLINCLNTQYKETKTSSCYLISSELSVFLSSNAKQGGLIELLTKLYDCEKRLDYHTMQRGKEECLDCCCNLLGATTPEWLKISIPESAIGGGFTSRVIFVYQDKTEKRISHPHLTKDQIATKNLLVNDLTMIGNMKGVFNFTKEAWNWYDDWYTDVFNPDDKDTALKGYYGRKHDTLLKVAMVMSASRGDSLLIDDIDLKVALKALNENERMLPSTVKLIEGTNSGRENDKLFNLIKRRGEIRYSDILRQLSYCMDAKHINDLLEGLVQQEMIKEIIKNDKRCYCVK